MLSCQFFPSGELHTSRGGAWNAGTAVGYALRVDDLADRGVTRLLVEGGGHIHTLFLTSGLADELRLAVAPFLVGEEDAPRFVMPGAYPYTPQAPMRLLEARALDGVAVLRYALDPAERR